ncbi:MAG: glycosyltransferase family 4 protein [Sphingomonadaceae bacterium]
MRIAINGYFLQQPATGSGQHLYYLLEGLDTVDESNQYLVLYPRLRGGQIVRTPHLGSQFRIKVVRGAAERLGPRFGKLWWEQIAIRSACLEEQVDLLHSPYFASPLRPNVPTVVTIHDVIPLVLPRYGRAPHVRAYNRLVSAAARRAEAVITVSETSKADIVRTLEIPPDRIHVIYNATDRCLGPVCDDAALEGIRDSYGIAGEFILYFGGFDERKNVERIVRAFQVARAAFDRPCQLVLAGSLSFVGQHPLYPDPRPLIEKLGLSDHVILTGRISEEEKPLLFSAATAFVFPSLYEGFGIPVLEAMACGAPVVTSDSSSLPEVVGDAALLVDPTSVEAIAEAMTRLVNDATLRENLRGRGFERVRRFSWEASALKTLEVYRQVVA